MIKKKMPFSIFFDRRKDRTLSQVKKKNKGNNIAKQIINEEHITCVKEPASEYLSHIAVSSENSQIIASGIIDFF